MTSATKVYVRPLTQQLWDCAMLDIWPGIGCCVDFGIDNSSEKLGAYQRAIKHGFVTIEELDAALGDGPALTKILQRAGYKGEITTPYDFMEDEESF